jgi:hypothetical protein
MRFTADVQMQAVPDLLHGTLEELELKELLQTLPLWLLLTF